MKNIKKIGALVLAVVMIMAMSTTAFATGADLTGGEAGTWTAADTPIVQDKTINVKKELKSDNADDSTVNAPTMSYTYAITAATGGNTVVDATTDHANSTAVTVTTKPGITENLTYTTSLSWGPAETLTEGSNYKDIAINFSNVVFTGYGVYRYVITETPATYNIAGVTETTGTHVRYLDVYVKAADGYTDGTTAAQWDIYGYVCMAADSNVTTSTAKTNGFVEVAESSSGAGDGVDPDIYYSYNVTVSKTVSGDTYVQTTHAKFPFTVKFENATVTQNVLPIVSVNNSSYATVGTALTAGNINSITAHDPTIGHEGSVTYTGIPSGTKVTVFETNNQTGTTYSVTTTGGDTNLSAEAVSAPNNSGNAISNAQTALAANTSKTLAFTNTLSLISPTGVTLRIAPYALILAAGIIILLLARRRKEEPEEA